MLSENFKFDIVLNSDDNSMEVLAMTEKFELFFENETDEVNKSEHVKLIS